MRTTLITLASGLLFSSFSQGSPHSLNRRAAATIPGFGYVGCQTEPEGARALAESSYFDDKMTVEKCAVACGKFAYFGVEYGRECYCADTMHLGSLVAGEGECNFACPGNSGETCGAGNRLNLYKKSTNTTPASTTSSSIPIPTAGPYTDKGCYTEATVGRALTGHVFYDDAMTVQKCATACSAFAYFGIEYHHECYCSNSIADGSVPAPAAECTFKCDGDNTQSCGGDWRLNMFAFAAPTTTAAPAPVPTGYVSEGCYTDNTGGRALVGAAFFDDSMTIGKCAAVCAGWELFGVEYGRECYCGSDFKSGSVPASAQDCSFNCPGNALEKCGAGDRLNVFRFGSASSSSSSSSIASSTTVSSTTTTTPVPSSTTTTTTTSSTTTTMSTTTTTSTITTTTTTTTTTSPTPVPTINVVTNGDFENTDTVRWIPSSSSTCVLCPVHNFKAGTDPNTGVSPHGGRQMAAVLMKLNAGNYFGNFETSITTLPNQRYQLSAWSWIPANGAYCQVRYYFQPMTPDQANNPYQSVNVASSTVAANRGVWKEATAIFTSGTGGVRAVIVQISCNGAANAERMIYVDDVSLALI